MCGYFLLMPSFFIEKGSQKDLLKMSSEEDPIKATQKAKKIPSKSDSLKSDHKKDIPEPRGRTRSLTVTSRDITFKNPVAKEFHGNGNSNLTNKFETTQFSNKDFINSLKNNPIFKAKSSEFEHLDNFLSDPRSETTVNTIVEDFFKSLDGAIKKIRDNEQTKAEYIHKKVKSLFTNVTPQNFEWRINRMQELEIDSEEILLDVVDQAYTRAVTEPKTSLGYALLCKQLSNIEVINSEGKIITFGQLFINRCQNELEKILGDENALMRKITEFKGCTDFNNDKELEIISEEVKISRTKLHQIVRFIGELFNLGMIASKTIDQIIRHLMLQVSEENLECLCDFLTIVGKEFEMKKANLSVYFKKLQTFIIEKGLISPRLRMRLLNLIILRDNNWILSCRERDQEIKKEDTQESNEQFSSHRY